MNANLSNSEKLNLVSNLGTMLSAGIPILEAVDSLLEEMKGSSKKILETLKADLNQGKTIASSFSKFPNAFDPVIVNLIKASEEAGTLEQTLKDLKVSIKKDIEFSERVRAALAYPSLVILAFFGMLILILTFVIPRIATVFSRLKVDLPLPTRILIATSNFILTYTPWVILGFLLFILLMVYLYITQRRRLLNFFFSLPLLSTLAREIDLTRFTRSMALLLQSGIPITEALNLSKEVVSKDEVLRALEHSQEMVSSGKKLSEGFKKARKVFPAVLVRITEAGEKSGGLDKSMQEMSEYFDGKVSNNLKTLTTLLEPILLIVIGVFVGGLMITIMAPIYQLIGNIRGR